MYPSRSSCIEGGTHAPATKGANQLHQLRGRIGRGRHPSLCLLATRLPETSKAGERIKAVAATLDGFALADLDLDERREGDVLGLNQSGRTINLRFLSLREHLEVITDARQFSEETYQRNPNDSAAHDFSRYSTRSKSDSQPVDWMPANRAFWCQYAVQFVAVLRGYGLAIDAPSAVVLRETAATCPTG